MKIVIVTLERDVSVTKAEKVLLEEQCVSGVVGEATESRERVSAFKTAP